MEDEGLNLAFAALADPTRRAILARLAQGDATVNVLAGPLPMSLQAVSRHLKVLEDAGLIARGRDAQFRPCSLRDRVLEGAAGWIAQTRETWGREMPAAGHEGGGGGGGGRGGGGEEGGHARAPGSTAEVASAFATRNDRAR